MAVGDLQIANSLKNELLEAQYTIGGSGTDKDLIYFSIGTTQSSMYNDEGRLGKFKFVDGVASFENNDPIMFPIEAEANETVTIKYIFIHDDIYASPASLRATITLQGNEIFEVVGGADGNIEALAISNIQINLLVQKLVGGN